MTFSTSPFFRSAAGAALLACLLPAAAWAATERAYIGTYTADPQQTSPRNHGEGIYLVDVDGTSGLLSNVRLVAKTPSPSWITLSPDGRFLYAGNEIDNFNGTKSGSVSAFAIDKPSGKLTFLNAVSSQGAAPAFIAVHPSGKYVLAANYTGGSLAVLPVKPDGSLGAATDIVHPTGPLHPPRASDDPPGNFDPSDHGASHIHMVGFDPKGDYVIADDAGLDQILVFKLDLGRGKLTPVAQTASPPGAAPRHFVFDPAGKIFYQLQEQDSVLASYGFDPATGKLTRIQALSTLPKGFAGSGLASELLISKDGHRLYAGNRLHDTIAAFSADGKGGIGYLGEVPTEADTPRSLVLDPSGKFLFSLNQIGDSVTGFRVGPSGKLIFTGQFLPLGSPAGMVFLP
jgi:6-phosphogluconolactonase (cycloisomerase 2 family)